jgi:hypothetical protein
VRFLTPVQHVLVVPQNVSIENFIMSREFAEAHTARVNPVAPYQMCTLDGRRALLSDDRRVLSVLPGEASRSFFDPTAADLSAFWDREAAVFEQERRASVQKTSRADTYVILREGTVDLGVFGGKGAVPVLLVSHAIKPRSPSKGWATHPATLGFEPPVDPFLAMSPMQGSSPREVYAESEDEAVDRIHSAFATSSNGLLRAAPPQQPQALDWIFEMGAAKSVAPVASASAPAIAAPVPMAKPLTPLFVDTPPRASPATRPDAQKKAEREREEREKREKLKAMFFEKMKHRKAADMVQSIKTFVTQFVDKPPPDTDRRAEVVRTYLSGLEVKIRQHVVWQGASDEELEEMSETLERFVVSKIYRVIFAPTAADLERDEKLQQRIQLVGAWLEPRHLDIELDLSSRRTARVMGLAVEQLQKWNTFKAPRDKMVCILNACKAVWKLLGAKRDGKAAGADDFLPHLIFTVIRANPPNLHSTVEYISRYRHPDKMAQEFGYYFTQLASVVPFLDNLSHKSFTMTEEEYNGHMNVRVTTVPRSGELPHGSSSVSLWDLPVSAAPVAPRQAQTEAPSRPAPPPQQPPPGVVAATSQMQRAMSMSALSDHAPSPQPFNVAPPAAAATIAKQRTQLPASTFRFVGRDFNTLTMAEMKEVFSAYEAMAKTL